MLSILGVTFPFFALVFAGYLAAKRGWLPLAAIPGLNGFVLYFALPSMLFRFGANTPMAQLLDGSVALLYALSASVMVLLGMWVLRRQHNWNESAFGSMAVSFPNTGYMGLPLLLSLFGPAAVGPAILTIVVDLFYRLHGLAFVAEPVWPRCCGAGHPHHRGRFVFHQLGVHCLVALRSSANPWRQTRADAGS